MLGFGKYAEVMEPESLLQEIKEEIKEMVGKYGMDKD
ncbi:WCX domain-containing protein [Schinkia azotoformans]